MKKKIVLLSVLIISFFVLASCKEEKNVEVKTDSQDHSSHAACSHGSEKSSVKEQTLCPVMGNKIDKNLFVDVKGKRIYVCCKGCDAQIKADPDKYIKAIEAKGEVVADAPSELKCPASHIKKCAAKGLKCSKDGKKCLKDGKALCSKCGEVKGTDKCCAKDAVKCSKCGLNKGAPGCCVMPAKKS